MAQGQVKKLEARGSARRLREEEGQFREWKKRINEDENGKSRAGPTSNVEQAQ